VHNAAARAGPSTGFGAAVWASGFRPFFLGATTYGPLLLLVWYGARSGWWPAPSGTADLSLLHGHEMLFGFAVALVCGVLLTALPSWAGGADVRGAPLAALAALWLAGRLAFYFGGWLPRPLVVLIDCALLPTLVLILFTVVSPARRRLLWWSMLPLAALASANILFHVALSNAAPATAHWALALAVHALMFLFVLYGGLFIPAFTRRWLHERREPSAAICMPLEYATALAMVAFAAADLSGTSGSWMTAAAGGAATLNAWRFLRWRGWRTAGAPLLWCVHLAYAWLIVALVLRAVSESVPGLPRDVWVHAFTVGAYGMLKIGLLTRVALRHTGRPLVVGRPMQLAFVAVLGAALLRLAFSVYHLGSWALGTAALLWSAALLTYLWAHGPMLLRPSLPRSPRSEPAT
jgi:uncharacterized protein involved in response to NO